MRIRSPTLFAISSWLFLAFVGWFVTEIIAHCYSDARDSLALLESSMQLFMYTSILGLACLAACWYADFVRTRASRAAALTVTTFAVFAWFYDLWFVIPAFRSSDDARNLYCANPGAAGINTGLFTSGLSRWCEIYRAAAAFAVAFEFAMFMTWLWAMATWFASITPEIPIPTKATILAPHHSLISASESGAHDADVNWRTELTEPDDLELIKIAANNPATHVAILRRTSMTSYVSAALTAISIIGWIVLTCSLIDLAKDYGLDAWVTTPRNQNRLGDPIISANWYWLCFSLGLTLAVSSYASYRRNRGIIGGAWLLTSLSALQWISIFIYSARRANQQSSNTNTPLSDIGTDTNSQFTEVAAIGLIAVCELLRSVVLFFRYSTYMLVTKLDHDRVHIPSHVDAPTVVATERDTYNPHYHGAYNGATSHADRDLTQNRTNVAHTEMNVPGPSYDHHDADLYVPSYNMAIMHGASLGFKIIFALQVLTILTWWVLQVVQESYFGLFENYQQAGPKFGWFSNYDSSYYYNEYMFLLSTILVICAYLPAFYAEREMSVASAASSLYTSMMAILGFFLLVWPFAYESVYGNGTLYEEVCTNGAEHWCRMTQAAGILALINAFFLFCLFIHAIIRVAERRLHITVFERNIHNIPFSLASLILVGIAIWSFVTLYFGLYTDGVMSQFRAPYGYIRPEVDTPAAPGYYAGSSMVQSYFAAMAFLVFASCSVALAVGVYGSKLMYAWQSWGWRTASLFTAMLPAAFLVPLIIIAARFIHWGNLNDAEIALCSAIIILAGGTAFYLASFCFLIHSAFYAAGATGAAIPPSGMVPHSKREFIQKHEDGTMVERDVEMGAMAGSAAYSKDTVYDVHSQPAVNPRTGDVAQVSSAVPVQETTTVTQTGPITAIPAVSSAPTYNNYPQAQAHTYGDAHTVNVDNGHNIGAHHHHQQPAVTAAGNQVYDY